MATTDAGDDTHLARRDQRQIKFLLVILLRDENSCLTLSDNPRELWA